jgi:5'-3' exonuclease
MARPERLHLVDGTFELYRAHFAPRPNRPLKATVGLASAMVALLSEAAEKVTHVAIAFDNPIRSFRNDLFAGYKSDEGVPGDLRAQFDGAEEAARALGLTVWSMKEFETDDALATAALRFGPAVDQVRILSPDKDFGQCLDGQRVVLVDRIRNRVLDEAAIREARGVGPASIPDLLALTGDTADGIPGVPGFGAKTAAALLAKFVHVEAIPDDPAEWPKGIRGAERLAPELRALRKEVALYKKLATLRTDVPLAETLDDLRYRGPTPELAKLTEKWETPALAQRAAKLAR